MGQITVVVNNQKYSLACRDGEEEHLENLAKYVDEKTKHLIESLGNVGEARVLLMAALLVSDELLETRDSMTALQNGDSKAIKEVVENRLANVLDAASERIEGIAVQLEST
ncbi:MAG: cell division protein ZapA [Sphingomonadales bacterium]|nr:cell division protein ZapA [Sphingomonadales bacterium]